MSFAFFDFDNTLIDGDAGPKFGMFLMRERFRRIDARDDKRRRGKMALWSQVIPFTAWMGVQTTLYKARAVRRSTVVRSAYKGLRGVRTQPLQEMFAAFAADEIEDLIFAEMVAEMNHHIQNGRQCVIITTGMEGLVRECLPFLPPTQLIGCQLQQKDGRLTGKVHEGPLYGAHKASIIKRMCDEAGVDPATCYAYTDHYSDHHMLDAVGHGVCVNPARRLERMAAKKGWRIMRPKRL